MSLVCKSRVRSLGASRWIGGMFHHSTARFQLSNLLQSTPRHRVITLVTLVHASLKGSLGWWEGVEISNHPLLCLDWGQLFIQIQFDLLSSAVGRKRVTNVRYVDRLRERLGAGSVGGRFNVSMAPGAPVRAGPPKTRDKFPPFYINPQSRWTEVST